MRREASLTFGVEPLLRYRPKHAALLAGISNAWAGVEIGLAELFGYLVAARYSTTRSSWSQDPMSNELWDSFQLTEQRLNLVRAAFNTRVNDGDLKVKFSALAEQVRETAKLRNAFVHAAWAVSAEYPEHIIRTKMRSFEPHKDEPKTLQDLWKVIERIQGTALAVRGFYAVVQSYLSSKLPEPPQPARTSAEALVVETRVTEPVVFDPPLFEKSAAQ
jgi:hypothetical protein